MGVVKLPFFTDGEKTKATLECVSIAAHRMDMHEHTAFALVTYFLEEVVNRVAEGRDVRIPGFGVWFPILYNSPNPNTPEAMSPRFIPAMGFRNEVRDRCPHGADKSAEATEYRRNNTRVGHPYNLTNSIKTFERIRATLRNEARKQGQDF